jgi:hypothetical protein
MHALNLRGFGRVAPPPRAGLATAGGAPGSFGALRGRRQGAAGLAGDAALAVNHI